MSKMELKNNTRKVNKMSNELAKLDQVLIQGDLSTLSTEQKLGYYSRVCESLGLNPLTKPFAYIKLNSKEVLYATRDCTDQLRSIQKISMSIVSREVIEGIYVVTAKGRTLDGREDEATGAVNIDKLSGEMKANAFMKAETKAKRRLTLSICGLGFTDESEIESIPGAKIVDVPPPVKTIEEKQVETPKPANHTETEQEYLERTAEEQQENQIDVTDLIGKAPTKEDSDLYWKDKTGHKEFFEKYPTLELFRLDTGKYVFQPRGTYAATKKAS